MKTISKKGLVAAALAATLGGGIFIGQAIAAQTHMFAALDSLRSARAELNEAEHNKGGHRERAISLIDDAIGEVQAGIRDGR
ncbi:MAG TPA: hypothetical protein VIJ72_01940 [Rhizomicrobium sp.]